MSTVIGIGAHKGGVGKTTASYNLSAGLAYRGYKVLGIDIDSQGNLTYVFRIKRYSGITGALQHDDDLSDVVRPVDPGYWMGDSSHGDGSLYVLGSNSDLGLEAMMEFCRHNPLRLQEYLAEYRDLFDFVIIDTPPTHSPYHSMVYRAADYIIIPTEMTGVSFMSMSEVMAAVKEVQFQHSVQIAGVLPNKVSRHKDDLDALAEQKDRLGDLLWPEIHEAAVWAKAFNRRKPLYEYVSSSMHPAARRAVHELWQVVDRVEALRNG